MKLTNETYEYIKGEVVAIFEEYDVKCIPISGFRKAQKNGTIKSKVEVWIGNQRIELN